MPWQEAHTVWEEPISPQAVAAKEEQIAEPFPLWNANGKPRRIWRARPPKTEEESMNDGQEG